MYISVVDVFALVTAYWSVCLSYNWLYLNTCHCDGLCKRTWCVLHHIIILSHNNMCRWPPPVAECTLKLFLRTLSSFSTCRTMYFGTVYQPNSGQVAMMRACGWAGRRMEREAESLLIPPPFPSSANNGRVCPQRIQTITRRRSHAHARV